MTQSQSLQVRTKDGVKFGKELRERDFLFEKGFLNLNHASFGTYPKSVRDEMRRFQDAAESKPDPFIRFSYPKLLDQARDAMATLLNAPSNTLVFLPNASTAINTVLRNLTFTPTDYILYFSTIYGACERTVLYITETTPARSVKIPYTYPVDDDFLVAEFHRVVSCIAQQGLGAVKIALFDTIVSMPGVRMPFERLARACRERGVMSCIDGAHGAGHIKIDLEALRPDFFVSNCHKWLHVPRGCAVFYVSPSAQHLMRSTLPTSHGFVPRSGAIGSPFVSSRKTPFVANFEFVGTIDNAPYLCVPAALAWRESLGGEDVVMGYCMELAQQGGKLVAEYLATEVMENATGTLGRCCMANVRLPISLDVAQQHASKAGVAPGDVGAAVRDWMHEVMLVESNAFVQTFFHGGKWWVRLSGQVYLEMEDMQWAAVTLGKVCKRVEKGEWAGKGLGSKL